LPPNMKKLIIIDSPILIVPGRLPDTITDLTFGVFNQVIEPLSLPRSLQSLRFGRLFNQMVYCPVD